jgi:Ser/Thr protein kinase RdoA (MazF antagonist)
MIEPVCVLNALRSDPQMGGDWALTELGEKALRLEQDGRRYFAKWIALDDARGRNELEINQTILREAVIPAPKLLYVLPGGEGTLGIWEWVEGGDLRHAQRELLPQAFSRLGAFHATQRGEGPLSSPISGRLYATIKDFLKGETHYLCADLPRGLRKSCARLLSRLECGYVTIIHGDMHPGNLCAAVDGPLLVDWGYSRWSINLLDLDYVRSIDIQPPESDWWAIQPQEAQPVLEAYYSTCGMTGQDGMFLQQAVMAWAILWGLHNSKGIDKTAFALALQRLEFLLEAAA